MKVIEEDDQNIDNLSTTKSLPDIDGYPANDSDNDNDKNEPGNDAENGDNRSRTQSVRDIDGYPTNDSEGDNDKNEAGNSAENCGETFENHEQNAPSLKEYAIETSHLQTRCEVCNKELQRTKHLPKRPQSI